MQNPPQGFCKIITWIYNSKALRYVNDRAKELHEKYDQEVKELKEQVAVMDERIFELQEAFQANELEWEAQERKIQSQHYEEETQLLSDIFVHEKQENDSFGKLFGKMIGLVGHRIKKGAGAVWRLATFKGWRSKEKELADL